ncbi:MAG: hypothetical protein ACE5GW_11395 [Planctomycetota bacterium]
MARSRATGLGAICGTGCRYLLILLGCSSLAAATWNLPRHQKTRSLEEQGRELERELEALERSARILDRSRWAFLHDPHFREGMLRRVTGERLRGELTLQEWIRLKESDEGRVPLQDSF